MVTVWEPGAAPKSPLWVTATLTGRSAVGAGLALSTNMALPPSVTSPPEAMLTSGPTAGCVTSRPLIAKVKPPVWWREAVVASMVYQPAWRVSLI